MALIALWIVLAVLVLRLRTPGQSVGDLLRVAPASNRLAGALYTGLEPDLRPLGEEPA